MGGWSCRGDMDCEYISMGYCLGELIDREKIWVIVDIEQDWLLAEDFGVNALRKGLKVEGKDK